MQNRRTSLLVLFTTLACSLSVQAQGLIQPGAGGMHQSMAGASTSMGVDALGALYWNPAAISGLPRSEVVIGSALILPDIHLGSTFEGEGGNTRSDSGLVPTTGLGLVYKPADSKLTYGLGINTLAAGGVNYPGDVNNPVLAPAGPIAGLFLLGPQAGSLLVLSIQPTVSYQLTECWAVGLGPMVDVSLVSFDPAFFGPPSFPGILPPPLGLPFQFPTGSHTRPFWGGGFRFGTTFQATDHLIAGFSYTSPQWFETWEFNARDASGNPITFETGFSLPQILSLGLAYDGIDGLLLAADIRWLDYRTTKLLGEPVVQGGANWDSIWAVALGARYHLSERMSFQAGYLFNENPVPSLLAFFNSQLPLVTEHALTLGGYFQLNEWIGMSAAYVHGFSNSVTGNLLDRITGEPFGASTTLDMEYDAFVFGIHVVFGPAGYKGGDPGRPSATTEAP
jgi:long-chain fatty acid transport protein